MVTCQTESSRGEQNRARGLEAGGAAVSEKVARGGLAEKRSFIQSSIGSEEAKLFGCLGGTCSRKRRQPMQMSWGISIHGVWRTRRPM